VELAQKPRARWHQEMKSNVGMPSKTLRTLCLFTSRLGGSNTCDYTCRNCFKSQN
jgi:hypothetical protein